MKKLTRYAGLAALPLATLSAAAQNARPNIIVVLTDDMGYSDLGCYGGEIETPNIDNLAANGLRYSQFYNNARSCPSRAVLMTGLYPHQAGMGWMACADELTPSYHASLNQNCVTIAEVLDQADYETYMVGKWHLCSERQCDGQVLETWPIGRGFHHYYGIPEGASNYFNARMVSNETRLPKTTDEDDFYITDALADSAVAFVSRHNYKDKPLFMYYAFNAPHWPLHARPADIARYKDRYREGWDKLRAQRFERQKAMGLFPEGTELSPRDKNVPAWDSLSPEEQNEFVNRMAIYAAQIDAIDKGIGKLVEALKAAGQFDNTVIMIMDDNGACAESQGKLKGDEIDGSSKTFESYRINWANMSSTPYREYKHYTNEGGIATPLIVSWPKGIDPKSNGSYVREYGYFADIMATCIDLAGATYPTEYKGNKIHPLEGVSLVPNFKGQKVDRGLTFWEHECNIAVRDGKWKLVILNREGSKIDMSNFELYDMDKDPTELHNLAAVYPDRVKSMFEAWDGWADKAGVYPLCNDGYGYRQQGSRRHINGTFDDNLGQWVRHSNGEAKVVYSIDAENGINGKTALIEIEKQGSRPGEASMQWKFPARSSKTMSVTFNYKTDKKNSLFLRVENVGDPAHKSFDKKVELKKGKGSLSFSDIPLSEGQKQLCFYFGNSSVGKIWLDDIEMNFD